ncbi:MAG: bifunctional demethylmenaquinone methyltransferase/2-methoxy-6-polyprenyl-1,4-benzoquinol methylase UbiE [Desulfobacteraceae bacterium]|nr:MAG: bifunctional demethylmenaquinone methyltransferase/2-methoxy-6-polyprenyl-1,4-benzoquinol methylase UbiE [Desulfobacteraceae bacterium]
MPLWRNPNWFDASRRREQLDDHIAHTGKACFGLRTFEENEKVKAVLGHFNRVAPKYDFMNSLLSLGIQHIWKRAAIRMLGIRPGDRILDVCGGTGDLAIQASRRSGPLGRVVIYDINWRMLAAGRPKIDPFPELANIRFVQGDAERISFPDGSFDMAMVGFGIRNLTHLKQGFAEMHRVLKPGGKILCLEFSRPTNPVFRWLYDFYSFNIMPLLGELIAGSAESYACLPETIRMFPLPGELTAMLTQLGFAKVHHRSFTNGIAVAHVGIKKGNMFTAPSRSASARVPVHCITPSPP